ncbi:DUF3494 domain-containing protein [Taibaiella lutea]|uniref:DUF3494 domain-containing protein n=1 Tax=Taibaiella lutea TaxID=2608001 RepID=A0A5M6CAP2_9BACT|nr:ice-binding family protein [Taibaiella lutea]KAA5532194.1 DUF3494 domain-containing protein [Taibaiella lutea]
MTNFIKSISIVTIFFLLPEMSKAQAPNLGTAASFALFTAVGAVGNTGISQITGNVGTNSGGITGFGNVNGVMHNTDGATLTAAADLLQAYIQLDTISPNLFHAPLLGNGDTLIAGIYSISGNTVLDQTLYLNAAGNANAVFIFKVAGTFSLNSLAQVKLINGAMACNVFWKIEGLVEMAPNAVMRGTVVANNAAININSGVTLEGRALSTAGAIAVSNTLTYTPVGCGSPLLTGPAAPNLGSASCYALFSGNGSNINSGNTFVVGDVGTNVGLTTGYNALNVTGAIHPIPDGSTASCASDLLSAYNYLNTLPADIELLYPAQFGNSLVLTPHTYLMNAATSFTDTLYLNAQGDSNAVFVIKINGQLSTSTYATVTLINGAKARNVYWKVDGAVDINNFSIIKGTIVCNNGAVNLNTGAQIEGRALTTNGAFTADAINIAIPSPCIVPLPLGLIYFRGKMLNNNVLLEWSTGKYMNTGRFVIEKSQDGNHFETLSTLHALSIADGDASNYNYTDYEPATGPNYYRLSRKDTKGDIEYFKTIMINIDDKASEKAQFYPNPWTSGLYLDVKDASALNKSQLNIYNVLGALIIHMDITEPTTLLDAGIMPAGVYYYQLISVDGKKQTGKLVSKGR